MKRRIVELLQCPACSGALNEYGIAEVREPVSVAVPRPACHRYCALLDVPVTPDADPARFDCQNCYSRDIDAGFLRCESCRLVFPIIDGVPRLVRQAQTDYRDFLMKHRDILATLGGHEALVKDLDAVDTNVFDRRTQDSFSLQWERYQYEDKTWFKDDSASPGGTAPQLRRAGRSAARQADARRWVRQRAADQHDVAL